MKKYIIFYIFFFTLCTSPQAEDLYGGSDESLEETTSTTTTTSITTSSTTVVEKGFNEKDFRNIPIVSVSWEEDIIDLSSAKNVYEEETWGADIGTFVIYENVNSPIYLKTPPWVDCNWVIDNYMIAVAPWSQSSLISLKYPTYSFSIHPSPDFECSNSTNEIIFNTWQILKEDELKIDEINLSGGFIFWENGNSGLKILSDYFNILPNQNNLEIISATPFVCPPGNLGESTDWSWSSLRIYESSELNDMEINCAYNKFFMRYIGEFDTCPTTKDLIVENSETRLKIIEDINTSESGIEIKETSCIWYDVRENNFFTFDMPMFKLGYAIYLVSS